MDGQAYFRVSWRQLICVVSVILLMGTLVAASLCAAEVCADPSLQADARCSGMAMPRSTTAANAQSHVECCQLTQGLPARQSIGTEKARPEFLAVPRGTGLASVIAIRKTTTRPVPGSSPHDVQSLFCTLLL
jgi:hypothetical protein